MASQLRVVIVGGGIGGLFAANALTAHGLRVSVYERLRRERVAAIQQGARQNGLRVDATGGDLKLRDAELVAHAEFRKQLYSYDVVAAARLASGVI